MKYDFLRLKHKILAGISFGLLFQSPLTRISKFLIPAVVILHVTSFFYSPQQTQAAITGVGILGASDSDEYRGTDNRGGSFASVTFNWMEHMADTTTTPAGLYAGRKIGRDINFGPWGTYSPTRRTGFAYNWGQSGHQSQHLSSQYPGLVQQVAGGLVSHVIIMIGQNDFSTLGSYGDYQEIYDNSLNDAQLAQKLDTINDNFNEAVDALKVANPNVKIMVTTIGDVGLNPAFLATFPNPSLNDQMYCLLNNIPPGTVGSGGNPSCLRQGRLRVSYAIKDVNTMLTQSLTPKGVHVVDMYGWALGLLAQINTGYLLVDGVQINAMVKSNNPLHFQLDDSIAHVGTVGNGLLANYYINNMNTAWNLNIAPFSECEILVNAGIKQPSDCGSSPTPTNTPINTITPSPTPSATSADLNNDGQVNSTDVILLFAAWLSDKKPEDLFDDNKVNSIDFQPLYDQFGQ